ncbi:MAG: carbonic anhydrase [Armatimonadetes bacterium]|nr:carbonic anhydrase [Armatimonadota bacterium]
MPFDDILDANRSYRAAHPDLPVADHRPARKLLVIACFDCRLTGMIEDALGIGRGDALLFRFSGNTLARESEILRSVAVAVYLLCVERILVVGHTDCGLVKVNTLKLLESMEAHGVRRDAFGEMPIRDWFGAFGSERENVERAVNAIRTAPFLPESLEVAGAMIDTNTGELRMV